MMDFLILFIDNITVITNIDIYKKIELFET